MHEGACTSQLSWHVHFTARKPKVWKPADSSPTPCHTPAHHPHEHTDLHSLRTSHTSLHPYTCLTTPPHTTHMSTRPYIHSARSPVLLLQAQPARSTEDALENKRRGSQPSWLLYPAQSEWRGDFGRQEVPWSTQATRERVEDTTG